MVGIMEDSVFVVLLVAFVANEAFGEKGPFEWAEWSRPTACSVTCGQGTTTRTRYCVFVKERALNSSLQGPEKYCAGPTEKNSPCFELACPVESCNCGCDLRASSGNLTSVLSYDESRLCEWKITVPHGSKIKLVINDLQLRQGNLRVRYGSEMSKVLTRLFDSQSDEDRFPLVLTSESNSVSVTLKFYKTMVALSGKIQLYAHYEEVKPGPSPPTTGVLRKHQALNLSAVIGISGCVIIIFLASVILAYRYYKRSGQKLDENIEVAEENDNASSSTSSNRSRARITSRKTSFSSSVQQRLLPGNKSKPGKFLPPESKDSAYESDHRRPETTNNFSVPRPVAYPDRNPTTMGRTLPYTASFWPMQPRRYSSEVEYRRMLNRQLMSQQILNQQQSAHILPTPMNIHMPHPQLGYMIRQAQLAFPPEIPAHVYHQQLQQQQLQQHQQLQQQQLQNQQLQHQHLQHQQLQQQQLQNQQLQQQQLQHQQYQPEQLEEQHFQQQHLISTQQDSHVASEFIERS